MIKKAIYLKTVRDKFGIPIDVFKIEPPFITECDKEEIYYLTGAFYRHTPCMMVALYASNEEGDIINLQPIIHEEGLNSYKEVFKTIGYTII